ncbi:MAG: ABC transporter substrate-binding protein [Clostridia bacterium]|nr:ABC transporter substrate-binding protein [Clostridia bacterium]
MKKLVALLLAVMMIAALLPIVASADEPVTITYLVTGDIPTNRTDEVLAMINEKLIEKVGAKLEIRWIEWTDWTTNYNLAIATQSGDIDLVGTATDWLDAWPNTQKGGFLPLSEEMLKEYAPLTWAAIPADHWEKCKFNGEIYLIPEDQYAQWTNHGFMYRGDWAAEAGLADGVHSWDDLGKYLAYVKENKPDVIPWDADGNGSSYSQQMSGGWQTSHTGNIYIEGMGVDLFYGESAENPYTLSTYYLDSDEFVNFAKTMKSWADAGYWRTDVLNYTGDVAAEMKEGTTAARQHHTETWTGFRTEMENAQPGSDLGFFWFGEEMGNVVTLNITHGAMAIASSSKNPEKALQVYDLLRNDPELYQLMMYGIPGEMYTLDDNGYIARPEGWDEAVMGCTFNWWWGRNDGIGLRAADRDWETIDKLYAVYNEKAVTYPYGQFIFDRTNVSMYLDNLSNVYNTYMPRIVFGMVEDPEAYVAEYRAALKAAGIDLVMEEIQRQLDAVYAK